MQIPSIDQRIFRCTKVLMIAMALWIPNAEAQYVREGSIGRTTHEEPSDQWAKFKFLPVDEWVGKRIIFLPKQKSSRMFAYHDFTGGRGLLGAPTYEQVAGKIAIVLGFRQGMLGPEVVVQVQKTGEQFAGRVTFGEVEDIAFLDEIDLARAELVGKTLWILSRELLTWDEEKDTLGSVRVKKFSPVKVTDVVVGFLNESPIRLILESESHDVGFLDVNISGTNASKSLTPSYHIDRRLSLRDPKAAFPLWPKAVWDDIQEGRIALGMTRDQVRLCLGEPERASGTSSSSGHLELWTYGTGVSVQFADGAVSAVHWN